MKIATFNVNGVNGRLAALCRWLDEFKPDVVCLQELKAPDDRFPVKAIRDAGYHAIWHGQKSWNGVAILARDAVPVERRRVLPGDRDDKHSRYIEATVGDVVIACLYLPNGNPVPGPRFEYKLAWLKRFMRHTADLLRGEERVVLAGDFNIIPTDFDVYAPERWTSDALFRPEVRAAYANLLAQGWTDALRNQYPDQRVYTFWKYLRNAFQRDAGLRIDHLLLSPSLVHELVGAGVNRDIRAREKPSDHAPVWIELARCATGR